MKEIDKLIDELFTLKTNIVLATRKAKEMLDRKETTNKNGKNDFDIIQLKEIINLLK